ncbi:MAG: hypothetical protein QXG25_03220 [Nitrososphaerota archaeon]
MRAGVREVKPVRIDWLTRTAKVSPMSPLVLAAEKLGIRWLMLFDGEYVYGSSPGLIEAADALIRAMRPRSLIDLFGGSGAVSKLAAMNGVKRIIYVDLYPEAAYRNLRGMRGIEIVREDAFKFLGRGVECDLLIADPPEELADKTARYLMRNRRVFRKAALTWIGSDCPRRKISSLARMRMTEIIEVWGDFFLILWNRGLRDRIERVKRMLE